MSCRRRFAATTLAALGFVVVAGACGSDGGGTSAAVGPSGSSAPQGTAIEIVNFAFEPPTLRAQVGDTITVANRDDTTHTLTADNGPIDTGDITSMETASFELTRPGTFAYHCNIHNYMTGRIKVSE